MVALGALISTTAAGWPVLVGRVSLPTTVSTRNVRISNWGVRNA